MMMKTLDIGHRNLYLDEAMTVLETGISDAMFGGNVQAVKIIHGHGSDIYAHLSKEIFGFISRLCLNSLVVQPFSLEESPVFLLSDARDKINHIQ